MNNKLKKKLKKIIEEKGSYPIFNKNGHPLIYAILVDDLNVYIKCPYCNLFHTHGSCGGSNYYGGFRVPHCLPDNKPSYYILKPSFKDERSSS